MHVSFSNGHPTPPKMTSLLNSYTDFNHILGTFGVKGLIPNMGHPRNPPWVGVEGINCACYFLDRQRLVCFQTSIFQYQKALGHKMFSGTLRKQTHSNGNASVTVPDAAILIGN